MKEKRDEQKLLLPGVQSSKLKPSYHNPKRRKFRPDIRTANAVVSAVVFLQKTGIAGTPKNIKICMRERSRRPFDHLNSKLSLYLSRGLELGILRRHHGNYRLGNFELKRRKRPYVKGKLKSKIENPKKITPQTNHRPLSKKSLGSATSKNLGPSKKLSKTNSISSKSIRETNFVRSAILHES